MPDPTDIWSGGSGRWDLPGNWSLDVVPNLNTNVEISGTETINGGAGGGQQCAALTIDSGADVTFAAADGYDGIGLQATEGATISGTLTLDPGCALITSVAGIGSGAPASLNVDDGGALFLDHASLGANAGGLVIGNSGAGTVGVTNDATATVTSGGTFAGLTIANGSGSTGKLTVTDHALFDLVGNGGNIGYASAAVITISSAGTFELSETGTQSAGVLGLGVQSSGSATVTVTGLGSVLGATLGDINIGYAGKADVTVSDGATFSVTDAPFGIDMASEAGASSTLTIYDATLTDGDNLYVGDSGKGALTVEKGSTAVVGYQEPENGGAPVWVGAQASGNGLLTVTGAGTAMVVDQQLDDGVYGTGKVVVEAGAQLGCGTPDSGLVEGFYAGSAADLVVSSGTLADAGYLTVGDSGTGSLYVGSGGAMSVGDSLDLADNVAVGLGLNANSTGYATITGTASQFLVNGQLEIGITGTGRMTVSAGATVNTGDDSGNTVSGVLVGVYNIATGGALTVTGAGSVLSNVGQFDIGVDGRGLLVVSDGGVVKTDVAQSSGAFGLSVATGTSSVAGVTLTGTGSNLGVATNLVVGNGGDGSLNVLDAASATIGTNLDDSESAAVLVGYLAGSKGAITVSGAGSDLAILGQLDDGDSGSGYVAVSSGATITSGDMTNDTFSGTVIGFLTGGNGTLAVTGASSLFKNTGQFVVAAYSTGVMTIEDGASVNTTLSSAFSGIDGADIGLYAKSTGTVTVNGAGSAWSVATNLVAGAGGHGVLLAEDDARVTIGTALVIGEQSGASGIVTVELDATLTAASADLAQTGTAAAGTASLVVDNGTVTLTGEMLLGKGGALSLSGGAQVTASEFAFNGGGISGNGRLNGSVVGGSVTASGGELLINGAVSDKSLLKVDANATLAFGGAVSTGVAAEFESATAATFVLADPLAMDGAFIDFAAGDTIQAIGQTETGYAFSGGKLNVTLSGGGHDVFSFSGSYNTASFVLTNNNTGFAITHS